uniref:PDZ domain-containing protein n=1 Tax=Globodera pallida TaxID=36090 RepID=A0A183CGT1_GLOPA
MVQQKDITSPTSGGVRLISSRFGFNVVGGVDAPHIPGYNGIFISRVRRLDLDGINEGDQILSVNGIELANKTHAEVLKILREASNNSTFMIESNAELRIASLLSEPMGSSSTSLCVEEGDDDSFTQSLPSSNLSNLSGRSEIRTRTSSSSTINQSVLREEGTVVRQQWAIEEDESTIDRSRSPSPFRPEENNQPESSSIYTELLYVSFGVIAIGTVLYFGYRRLSK